MRKINTTNLFFVIICTGSFFLIFFSDRGLIELYKLKKEVEQTQYQINLIREKIDSAKQERDLLSYDEKYLEEVARNKLKMVYPGEKVFSVEE